jgi:hypothetical protein
LIPISRGADPGRARTHGRPRRVGSSAPAKSWSCRLRRRDTTRSSPSLAPAVAPTVPAVVSLMASTFSGSLRTSPPPSRPRYSSNVRGYGPRRVRGLRSAPSHSSASPARARRGRGRAGHPWTCVSVYYHRGRRDD